MEKWVKDLTEEVMGGSPFKIGHYYQHPNGIIKIIGGQYWGQYGLSNHWHWEFVETGERDSGYGTHYWPEVEYGQ